MTITAFGPSNLGSLRIEMDAALKAVADKHGIKFTLGKMTYDHTGVEFRCPLTANTSGAEGRAARQAISFAESYGVDAKEPSTHPKAGGAVLVEYRPRAGKRPWVYELGGKQYVTTQEGLRQMWPKVAEVSPI